MLKRTCLLLALFLLNCVNSPDRNPAGHDFGLNDNDRQIYSLLINPQNSTDQYESILIVNCSQYMVFDDQWLGNKIDAKVTASLKDHYNAINADSIDWRDYPLDVGINYRFIEQGTLDSIFNTGVDGWDSFYTRYDTNGYYTFSKIAYNADSTVAIVSFSHIYGSLGADWVLTTMIKENGAWKEYKNIAWYVS